MVVQNRIYVGVLNGIQRFAAMSSTTMHHAIKLQLKFIGCIAYRCGYAQVFIINFKINLL